MTIINTNDAPYFTSFKMEGGKNISGDAGEVKFNIDEDESVAMIISGNDPDFIHGDEVLDFSLADHYPDRTAIEKISDSKSRLTYIPRPDFNGDEVITVKLTDGEVTLSKTIRFRIEPVNDPPVTKHWEIWTATGDNDSTTPEIENLSYRFHVRDKARKEILTNETIMDVDGDLVEFAWFYYKDGEAVNLLWDQANEKGTSLVKNFKESEQGEWIIVLMCNDNNGSFQIIEENNITVKKYIEIEENGGNGIVKHDRTEVPFLIIILCAVFLIVIIVGFVFFTSRTKFNMLEKAAKEREEAERVRIIEAVESSYQAQSAWAEQETEVYQGDFEESFFGVGPTSDAEEETFDLDLELPESGPALPIESPMMADAPLTASHNAASRNRTPRGTADTTSFTVCRGASRSTARGTDNGCSPTRGTATGCAHNGNDHPAAGDRISASNIASTDRAAAFRRRSRITSCSTTCTPKSTSNRIDDPDCPKIIMKQSILHSILHIYHCQSGIHERSTNIYFIVGRGSREWYHRIRKA